MDADSLTVSVSAHTDGTWSVSWNGNLELSLEILGALEYAKHQAVAEMDKTARKPIKAPRRMAKRDDAINFYLDMRAAVERRLQAINNSDEKAIFEIPTAEI